LAIAESAPTPRFPGGRARADLRRALWEDPGGRLSLIVVGLFVLLALLAPVLAPYHFREQLDIVALKLQPPSAAHPFGTDSYSRDVLSRMLMGARVSLAVAVLAAGLSAGVGLLWGSTAGYFGGATDALLSRMVDALLSIPRVLLVLTVVALWEHPSVPGLVLTLGLTGWFGVSRLARAQAIAARGREFVVAARALGVPHRTILVRHVLPQALGPVLVAATIAVGQVIVLEAGLSFLGYGIPQPTPSWGNIIHDGRETIATTWWLTLFPGLALVTTSLAVTGLANRLRTAFNPHQLPAA
jgi:peptide/nickel transport system permease protein